jgi:hypothetical protein
MNRRPENSGSRLCYGGALGLWLALAVSIPAQAQVGPITTQSLFFDQASNAHNGNYLAVESGLVYTDNADLTEHGSGSLLALLGLVGDVARDGTRLDYHLISDLAVVKYFSGDISTRPAGYLDGNANLKIVPGLFSWIARESYVQETINPFVPPTPNNLEDINTVSTGPRFVLRPTLRTTIVADALASYVYSSSPSDLYVNVNSWRYSGDLSLDRAFTSYSSAYIKGNVQRVLFSDTELVPTYTRSVIGVVETLQPANSDYTMSEGVAGFKYNDTRTVFDASGGINQVRVNDETFRGAAWSVNLSRLITPEQRLAFLATQSLTDAVNLFQQNFNQAVPTLTAQRLGSGDPFQNRQFGVTWRFQASRTAFDVSLLDTREKYVLDSALDVQIKTASALAARQLNPVLNWDVGVQYEHEDFETGGPLVITSVITNLRWQVGPKVQLRFLYGYSHQNPGYVDNQIGVTVSYALVGTRAPLGSSGLMAPLMTPMAPASALPPLF